MSRKKENIRRSCQFKKAISIILTNRAHIFIFVNVRATSPPSEWKTIRGEIKHAFHITQVLCITKEKG
jgi:hypothetical protein